jgi:hypothetical protein
MSPVEYEAALAAFMRKRPVTRCPTVCVLPTRATVADADRAAYRAYAAEQDAARLKKQKSAQQIVHG